MHRSSLQVATERGSRIAILDEIDPMLDSIRLEKTANNPHLSAALQANSGQHSFVTSSERRLRQQKFWATSCLAAVSGGWLVSHYIPTNMTFTGYLRAACEAGMVGGVADWFAVTALFRHPLGLPIPHTGLIPRNQPRIAEGVAEYIDSEFLERETLVSQLRRLDVAAKLSSVLDQPENRARFVDGIMNFIPRLIQGRDGKIADAISASIRV